MFRNAAIAALLSSLLLACAAAGPSRPGTGDDAPGERPVLSVLVRHHLKYHQHFPATRADVLASLEETAELTPDETARLARALPPRHYDSADEVLSAAFGTGPDLAGSCRAPKFATALDLAGSCQAPEPRTTLAAR
jgi:hypothetical protein